jgi:hypothetical protein
MKQSIENGLENLQNIISLEVANINQENDGYVDPEDRESLFQDLSAELIILAAKVILMQNGIGNARTPLEFSFTTDEGMEYNVMTKEAAHEAI